MCHGCYVEAGEPMVVNPVVLYAVDLIDRVYQFSCTGGGAHIILDDWNLDDDDLRRCLDEWIPEEAHSESLGDDPARVAAEREAVGALLAMTMEERVSALAIHEGFLTREGEAVPW